MNLHVLDAEPSALNAGFNLHHPTFAREDVEDFGGVS
jgi:hypothetical protein